MKSLPFSVLWRNLHGTASAKSIPDSLFPDFLPFSESFLQKRLYKPSAKAPARRGRPPLAPELYVEFSGKQYNVTDIIDRAKADYRATHKVGVQSCKVYIKPEEGAAYYVINKVSGKLEL